MYNLPFWFSDGKIAKIVPTMIYRAGRLLLGAVNSPGALNSGVGLRTGCGVGLVLRGISSSMVSNR